MARHYNGRALINIGFRSCVESIIQQAMTIRAAWLFACTLEIIFT